MYTENSKHKRILAPKKALQNITASDDSDNSKNTHQPKSNVPDGYKLRITSSYYPWIAMILSTFIWFKFTAVNPGTIGNTSNIYRIVLVVFAGIYVLNLLMKQSSNVGKAVYFPIALLLLYGFIAFFSSLMVPAQAFYTMWKSIEIIVDVFAIIAIMAAINTPLSAMNAYRFIISAHTLILFLVIAGAFISPGDAFRGSRGVIPVMLQGFFPIVNPNSLGFISVLIFIHNVAVWSRTTTAIRKNLAIILICTSFVALIFAQSRTSSVALVLALAVYLYLDNKRGIALAIFSAAGLALAFTSSSDLLTSYMQRGQSTELMTSLSGRTHGWTAAWEMFKESPYIGHGFAAAARTEILGSQNASTLHGAIFDVIVGVGLAGLIPWGLAILLMLKKMFTLTIRRKKWITSTTERSIHAELSAITVILVIRTTTSSGVAMHDHAFMLLLCLIAYSYAKDYSLKLRRRSQF